MTATPVKLFQAFDPGITTGYARAVYKDSDNTLFVTHLVGLRPNDKFVNMESPPIKWFREYDEVFSNVMNDMADVAAAAAVFTVIENFTGGAGGDLQNTVNKIIGQIMSVCFAFDGFEDPKLYRNSSRKPFLMRANASVARGTNKHGIDAFAHLLHRVQQELTPEQWEALTIKLAADAIVNKNEETVSSLSSS